MTFLGHIIFSEEVEVDLRKMEAVRNCPRPLTLTDIRNFISLASYYQRFVMGFSYIESPMTIDSKV